MTFVVRSVNCVDIFLISGFPSSSSLFRRISIDVTVLFVLFTMSKIALRVGSISAAMLVLSGFSDISSVSGIVFAPVLVLGILCSP